MNKIYALGGTNNAGEKQEITFIYTNKTADDTPSTITETVKLEIDEIVRNYAHADQLRYRVIGTLIEPSTITTV